jgi:hypothetical protein
MNNPDYLLTLMDANTFGLQPVKPCPVGFDQDGVPVQLDTLQYFGISFLNHAHPEKIIWHAVTKSKSTADLSEFFGFHCGAMVSPRVRSIIEEYGIPNIEFIPLKILHSKGKGWESIADDVKEIGDWWFVNVFNWRDIFDFERSKLEWEDFLQPLVGRSKFEHQFGERRIAKIDELVLLPSADTTGLYLARGPRADICRKVFIGEELAERINADLPPKRRTFFKPFLLKDRPPPPVRINIKI